MVDANEFVELQQGQAEKNGLKLAIVTSLTEISTARVTFFGEEAESQKGYSYSSTYKPVVGDTVLMIQFADTYIIACKVMLPTDTPVENDAVTQDMLNETLNGYVATGDIVNVVRTNASGVIVNTVSGEYNDFFYLKTTRFSHIGTSLGFFGKTPNGKTTIFSDLSSSAGLADVITRVNEIRTALAKYGLV